MTVIGEAYIEIRPEDSGEFEKQTRDQVTRAASGASQDFSRTFSKGMAALAGASALAFSDFDRGADAIITKSGATGEALEDLTNDMKAVATSGVTSNLGEVGETIGELASRTKLTGPPMQELTRQIVLLSEITGGDASDSVDGIIDLFRQWQVETSRQSSLLDLLLRASQESGSSIDSLIATVTKARPALQNLGFGLIESIALITKIERSGGNSEKVIAALTIAFNKLAAAGKEPVAAFTDLSERIQQADTDAKAAAIAVEAFGSRAGPVLAASIRRGTFSIEQLAGALAGGESTIESTREATIDLADRFKQLRNQIVSNVGATSQYIAAFATIAAGTAPAIAGLRRLGATQAGLAASNAALVGGYANLVGVLGTLGAAAFIALDHQKQLDAASANEADAVNALTAAQRAHAEELEITASGYRRLFTEAGRVDRIRNFAVAMQDANLILGGEGPEAAAHLTDEVALANSEFERWGSTLRITEEEVKRVAERIRAGADPTAALAEEFGALGDAAGESASHLRELKAAQIALAGGFLGVLGAARSARESNEAYADAVARVNRLQERGKQGTKRFQQAVRDQRDAQLAAVETQLGLREAVRGYLNELKGGDATQQEAIRLIKDAGDKAGLTKGQTDKLIGSVEGLIGKFRDLPKNVETKVALFGIDIAISRARELNSELDRAEGRGGGGGGGGGGRGGGGGGSGSNQGGGQQTGHTGLRVAPSTSVEIEMDGKTIFTAGESYGRRQRVRFRGRDDG